MKEQIEVALATYIKAVRGTGLVKDTLIGVNKNEDTVYVVNVFFQDVKPEEASDSLYAQLTRFGGALRRGLFPEVPIKTSYLNPSDLENAEK